MDSTGSNRYLGQLLALSNLLHLLQGVVVGADAGIVDSGEPHHHGVPDATLHGHINLPHHQDHDEPLYLGGQMRL